MWIGVDVDRAGRGASDQTSDLKATSGPEVLVLPFKSLRDRRPLSPGEFSGAPPLKMGAKNLVRVNHNYFMVYIAP